MVWKSPLASTQITPATRIMSPFSATRIPATTRMVEKAWDGKQRKLRGIHFQVFRVIARRPGVKADEIASMLLIQTSYADELCETLVKDGHIIPCAIGGYTLKENMKEEVLELIKMQHVINRNQVSKQFMVSPEEATSLCEKLVKTGDLIKTKKGEYLLKKDKDLALSIIQSLKKETTNKQLAELLDVPVNYAGQLCDLLAKEYSILKTPKRKFIPAGKNDTRLLRIVAEHGWTPIPNIVYGMGITPACAELQCGDLVKRGYLKKVDEKAYALTKGNK